jgi:hypothetical protein
LDEILFLFSINLWILSKQQAINKYGHISNWDTSLITDMSHLISIYNENNNEYDEDIDNWNISNVKNMAGIFWNAISFNPINAKWYNFN